MTNCEMTNSERVAIIISAAVANPLYSNICYGFLSSISQKDRVYGIHTKLVRWVDTFCVS